MSHYDHIRQEAYEANMQLPQHGLVLFTFGNASAADHDKAVFAIKPSGIDYNKLTPDDMVIVDYEGKVAEGKLRPSSDTLTHAFLYRHWNKIGGIVHTHSTYATVWAQSQKDIPVLGTTHADYTQADIPCCPPMNDEMIKGNYEMETGRQIIDCFASKNLDYESTEMILVGNHAPFTWGKNAARAVHNSAVLEYIAKMAALTIQINPEAPRLKDALIRKHFERKHGPHSYYGQT